MIAFSPYVSSLRFDRRFRKGWTCPFRTCRRTKTSWKAAVAVVRTHIPPSLPPLPSICLPPSPSLPPSLPPYLPSS